MTTKETYKERQESELEVLQSIFNDDIEDLRPHQDKWLPLDLRIKLIPQKDSKRNQQYVFTFLRISCGKLYPKVVPKISLEESKGLTNQTIQMLLNQLNKEAYSLKGEVMIFELTQSVRKTLSENNSAPLGSFYEEMLLNKQKQEESIHQQNKLKEDNIRQAIQDEVMKCKLELQKETRIKRSYSESSPMHRRSRSTEVEMLSKNLNFVKECDEHQGSHLIQFLEAGRRIQQGCCLGHSDSGCIHFSGVDLDSGELCFLTEFTIPISVLEATSKTVDEVIKDIERQISSLSAISHKNLVAYKCVQCFKKKENLLVYLCQEFIQGNSVYCIYNSLGLNSDGVRIIAKGVLEALNYLHNNGVSHGNVNDSTVFLDKLGMIRVSDYSVVSYLQELASNERSLSNDLPALGSLVESLIMSSSTEMKDFVDKCKSERTLSASDLLEHPFLYPHLNDNTNNALTQNRIQLQTVAVADRPQLNINFPNLTATISEKSRLQTEFEIINYIGKGAFGDVLKVRNILDNRQYAIKRIPLTYKNKQLYRKMTREVELLSRLNHENVVRYYNSWIENSAPNSTTVGLDPSDPSTYSVSHESVKRNQKMIAAKNLDSIDDSSSLSDWIDFQSSSSGSDSVEFVNSKGNIVHYEDEEDEEDTPKPDRGPRIIQLMYIQMEFCEKSTLRTAIDSELYKDKERYWRLFREIVEGLAHIHQQGMIHRDLKPVNIFLDSKDCVKIGDFGLATTSVLALNNQIIPKNQTSQNVNESLTGHVGTALYISPELSGSSSKCSYNQKVDLYSLGIIFFEMCTPAATTGMERVKTIAALRTIDVEIPDFLLQDGKCQNEVQLLKWLLNHDASKRPTSEELLQSELVPPAKLEAQELQEMVRHCLANPQSRTYKHLIARCLMQQSDAVCELTYHLGMVQISALFENVKNKIVRIFRKHGALDIVTPLLTPNNKESSHNAVKLMTHSGLVVTLPYDLRQPFLHFMALNSMMNCTRRYTIGRVYREKKIFNFHPKQLFACDFDIVSSNRLSFLMDAEVLFVASEIVNEFDSLKQKQLCFRINHTGLLKAIFLYCSVPKDKYKELLGLLGNFVDQKLSKFQLSSAVNNLLPWNDNSLLIKLLQIEMNLENLHSSSLRTLIKGRGEATIVAKAALRELETVINLAHQQMNVLIPIVVQVGLAAGFDGIRPGGIVWQLVGELKSGRQQTVLACGGSFDNILNEYQKNAQQSGVNTVSREMFASGFSFALDKLVLALAQLNENNNQSVDVVVFVNGSRPPIKEVISLLRSLWSADIRSCVLEATSFNEDVGKELGANHIILLGDGGELRLKSWQNDSFNEKYVSRIEIIEYLKKNLSTESTISQDVNQTTRNNSITAFNKTPSQTTPAFTCIFSINEKLTVNKKKRLENQVEQKLSNVILKFNKKEQIIIYIVDLHSLVVKALVGIIEPNPKEQQSPAELDVILERFPKQRRYIVDIFDEVTEKKFKNKQAIVGIYTISDSYYRIIL